MRNPKDAGRVREALQEAGLADEINPAIVAAPICRPELRSETAALPVLPLADRNFKPPVRAKAMRVMGHVSNRKRPHQRAARPPTPSRAPGLTPPPPCQSRCAHTSRGGSCTGRVRSDEGLLASQLSAAEASASLACPDAGLACYEPMIDACNLPMLSPAG